MRWAPEGHPYRDSLRDFVALVGTLATARIARSSGRVVHRKTEVPKRYRDEVGDEWTPLVEFALDECRRRWGFAIPNDARERQRLRAMCELALDLENAYYAKTAPG